MRKSRKQKRKKQEPRYFGVEEKNDTCLRCGLDYERTEPEDNICPSCQQDDADFVDSTYDPS